MKRYDLKYASTNNEWHGMLDNTLWAGFAFSLGWFAAQESLMDVVKEKLGDEAFVKLVFALNEYERELDGKIESPVLNEDGAKLGEIAEYAERK